MNWCAMQKERYAVATSEDEIEQILRMQMLTSVVKLLAYHMYWSQETRFEQVAKVVRKNR